MTALGLILTQYYEEIAAAMEDRAREKVARRDAEIVETVSLPGVYDTPLAADRLARRVDIDAVAVLGAVVTGDTDHDQVVAHTAARRLSEVSLQRDTPVTFGVLGPAMSYEEAEARIDNATDAVTTAIDTVDALPAASVRDSAETEV
jgi:6,7-dimethyl-8-ribityllumazine synthase